MGADSTPSAPAARARIWVSGRVQGVGYRAFAQAAALRLALHGGVRNLEDGRVEVEVQGPRAAVDTFLEQLRAGPPGARVEEVRVQWEPSTGRYVGFRIWY